MCSPVPGFSVRSRGRLKVVGHAQEERKPRNGQLKVTGSKCITVPTVVGHGKDDERHPEHPCALVERQQQPGGPCGNKVGGGSNDGRVHRHAGRTAKLVWRADAGADGQSPFEAVSVTSSKWVIETVFSSCARDVWLFPTSSVPVTWR